MSGIRTYPRVPMTLEATLVLPNGKEVVAPTKNVSLAGFQASVGPETVACLFPDAHQPAPRVRQLATVALCAPRVHGVADQMHVNCAAVVARRVSESEFHVGFQFLDPTTEDLRWLEARIAEALRDGARS